MRFRYSSRNGPNHTGSSCAKNTWFLSKFPNGKIQQPCFWFQATSGSTEGIEAGQPTRHPSTSSFTVVRHRKVELAATRIGDSILGAGWYSCTAILGSAYRTCFISVTRVATADPRAFTPWKPVIENQTATASITSYLHQSGQLSHSLHHLSYASGHCFLCNKGLHAYHQEFMRCVCKASHNHKCSSPFESLIKDRYR